MVNQPPLFFLVGLIEVRLFFGFPEVNLLAVLVNIPASAADPDKSQAVFEIAGVVENTRDCKRTTVVKVTKLAFSVNHLNDNVIVF